MGGRGLHSIFGKPLKRAFRAMEVGRSPHKNLLTAEHGRVRAGARQGREICLSPKSLRVNAVAGPVVALR